MDITEDSKRELCKNLWLANEPRLRRLCTYKLSSHPDEVNDILAETALILWMAILEGTTIEYPNTWLYKVTDNLIKKKYTELNIEKERRVAFDDEEPETYNLAVGYDVGGFLITDDFIEKFFEEFDFLLTEDEKQLFDYVYEDRLKMKEIAVILSSTESAVKQRNYRLTRKIKRLVKIYLENH